MLPINQWTDKQWVAFHELARRGKLTPLLHKGQRDFFRNIADRADVPMYSLLYCARRWGKTFGGVIYGVEHCLLQPKQIVRHITVSLKSAKESIAPIVQEICSYLPEELKPQYRRAENMWEFPNGSKYMLGGAAPDAVENNRGAYSTLIICDEAGFWDAAVFEYLIKSVLLPQMSHYAHAKFVFLTTPPASVSHPLLTLIAPECTRRGTFQRATVYTNPLLSPEQIERMKEASGGAHSVAWRREFLAELVQDDSLRVIPEYDTTKHFLPYELPTHGVAFEPVTGFAGIVVSDYGVGTRDYSAVGAFVYDHVNNKLILVREAMTKGQGLASLAETVKSFEKLLQTDYNCTNVDTVIDIMAQAALELRNVYGLSFRSPSKVKLIDMIGGFRNAVEHGRIIVSTQCPIANQTFATGLWKKTEQSLQFDRTPELGHLDMLAAAVYAFRACPWGKGAAHRSEPTNFLSKDLPKKELPSDRTVKPMAKNSTSYSNIFRSGRNRIR